MEGILQRRAWFTHIFFQYLIVIETQKGGLNNTFGRPFLYNLLWLHT